MDSVADRMEILERLRPLVSEKLVIEPVLLQTDARLSDIGIDSFALIELVFLAEAEFKINIPFEGMVVNTVSDVLNVIQQRLAAAGR